MIAVAIAEERAYQAREHGKRLRTIRNKWMATFRSVPRARHAQHVVLTAWQIDPEASFILKTFGYSDKELWIRSRRLARELVSRDRRAGGQGFFVQYEYRRCLVCRRMLIGAEAATYRERCRYPKRTWQHKQGPVCGNDCVPKQDGRKIEHKSVQRNSGNRSSESARQEVHPKLGGSTNGK